MTNVNGKGKTSQDARLSNNSDETFSFQVFILFCSILKIFFFFINDKNLVDNKIKKKNY